jgi:hypothetical protein
MIRQYPDDKDAGAQVASDLFTTFHADTPDGERFFQAMIGRFLCFAPISSVSPQNWLCLTLRDSKTREHACIERHSLREPVGL